MNKKMIALLFKSLLIATISMASHAKEGEYCQVNQTACKPCSNDEDDCNIVHGKRIDNGDSLGSSFVSQTNKERALGTETFVLSDAPSTVEATTEVSYKEQKKIVNKAFSEQSTMPLFVSGHAELTTRIKSQLDAIVMKLRDKEQLHVKVIGHTDNQKLSVNAKKKYINNKGLGLARAKSAAKYLSDSLGISLNDISVNSEGAESPLATNSGLSNMAKNRRIEIQVNYVFPEEVIEKIAIKEPIKNTLLRSCDEVLKTRKRASNQAFRISVDGVPLSDVGTIDPDVQRCTDVSLDKADIQVRYDNLEETPWLNLTAFPNGAVRNAPVKFTAYSNYQYWIVRSEVRIFSYDDSTQATPIATVAVGKDGHATWIPDAKASSSVRYVLRAYDKVGKFDETLPQELQISERAHPIGDEKPGAEEDLIGYGENRLALHNIKLNGGAVTVNGEHLQPGQRVRFLGQEVPVDKDGKFAARQILPAGNHVVDVVVLDENGQQTLTFNRNLYIPDQDWFYIALADLTAGRNSTSGPAKLVTGDDQHFDNEAYVDGRLAFYLKGKIKGDWLLTASADTQEQPIKHLFSNFEDKDPRYLLRRLDPDRYYPVYGDDSTTVDDAPTRGKFYIKLARGESHVMWGNFQTKLPGNDLVQFSRGMYGGNLKLRSEDATAFGQKRTETDLFVGDPGTLGAREQFRGTGGSLYYVRNQDVTRGSEHIWVEVRDRDSDIVLKVTELSVGQDYDFDPIQGRILLRAPLPSTADDSQLVRAGSLSGHAVYLVATYEYAPSITEIDNLTVGGRISHWVNDSVQLGVTGYRQGDKASRQEIFGLDATYRYSPGIYLKAETARSDGLGTTLQSSATGGFEFNGISPVVDRAANAHRIEFGVDLSEMSSKEGKISGYWLDRDRGFSSPNQITSEEIKQSGFAVDVNLTDTTSLQAKVDVKQADSQDSKAVSASVKHQFTQKWAGSVGIRLDDLDTTIANASPTLSEDGERADLALQVDYSPLPESENPDWSAYGFLQNTINNSGNRRDNDRVGIGGKWRVTDRLTTLAEVSSGNTGFGGKLGGDWRINDRSQMYLNYALDTDRTDTLYRGRQGTMVAGSKLRYSDSLSVYGEERYLHGDGPSGLMHAFGLDLAAEDGWNYGMKGEVGQLSDPLAGDFDRKALSFSIGRSYEKIKYAGNLEWRKEDGNLVGSRTTWLVRNSLGYQVDPDWRILGKLNFSISESNQGSAFDADFAEGILGYAYRPVDNDKLNALFKYTYFANLPSPGAVFANGVSALTPAGNADSFEQRSHILSVDAIYDIKPWLSVGGKYGFRRGEIRLIRNEGDWESSDAHLYVVRADWHFVHDWDAIIEGRWLDVKVAEDTLGGALVGVYRHVNDNVKVGAGYNFTDFSDDLTDLSYRSKGWFVNLISKF